MTTCSCPDHAKNPRPCPDATRDGASTAYCTAGQARKAMRQAAKPKRTR